VLSSITQMGRKQRSRGRQVHPKGPLDTVDDDLKEDIRKAMHAKGWDQKDLAGEIPVAPASITNMFKPGPRQIRFKARLFEVLGIAGVSTDEYLRRVERNWIYLTPEDAAHVTGLIESLAKKP
jgi:hypothetical protein